MCRVKYFINSREPEAVVLANRMREAAIDFCSLPTSGCMTLLVDGHASYGPTAVRYAVHRLVESEDMVRQFRIS